MVQPAQLTSMPIPQSTSLSGTLAQTPSATTSANAEKDLTSTTAYTSLPVARIKKIMRTDPSLIKQSSDSGFTAALILEQFLAYLVKHSLQYTLRDKRKVLAYKDIASCVSEVEQFAFLADIIPMSISKAHYVQQNQPKAEEQLVEAEVTEEPNGNVKTQNAMQE